MNLNSRSPHKNQNLRTRLLGAEHFGLLPDGPPRLVEYLDGLRSRAHFVPSLERTESFFLKRDSA